MNIFRKTFLMIVGATSLALDEVEKSIKESSEVIQERRQRFARKTAETKTEPAGPAAI